MKTTAFFTENEDSVYKSHESTGEGDMCCQSKYEIAKNYESPKVRNVAIQVNNFCFNNDLPDRLPSVE